MTTSHGRFTRVFLPSLLALSALSLGACETTSISGMVVAGPSSRAVMVDAKDARLTGPGIEGAELEFRVVPELARSSGNTPLPTGQSVLISSTKADSSGRWTFTPPDPRILGRPVTIVAKKDGYIPARSAVLMGGTDKRVLVVLKSIAEADPETTTSAPAPSNPSGSAGESKP
ncbi:MAG: hypothetical protein SFY95_07525 [Planctomycetota bacterium]|nr:hypothetical protein [Planctomycetota bacterium]